jgi:uncharacterized protein (DUF488 family)
MIYTIGYAGTDQERFIDILKSKDVNILIDVRSLPKSKYFYQFNDNILSPLLAQNGIRYQNWQKEFGARQNNTQYFSDGILDYQKFAKSPHFLDGISKIKNLVSQNYNICLMCAEIDPLICHRAILCGKEIYNQGYNIAHIIAKRNGETLIETQQEFEVRLCQTTKINNLSEAYCVQSRKIVYN